MLALHEGQVSLIFSTTGDETGVAAFIETDDDAFGIGPGIDAPNVDEDPENMVEDCEPPTPAGKEPIPPSFFFFAPPFAAVEFPVHHSPVPLAAP